MEIKIDTFKEKPVLKFMEGERVLLAFGLKKAKLIVENIEKIKEFSLNGNLLK